MVFFRISYNRTLKCIFTFQLASVNSRLIEITSAYILSLITIAMYTVLATDFKYAHDEYRSVLVDSRVGINQTPESIQSMNDLLVPLIRDKHQSIGHIYATCAEESGCSRRTLYSYINDCVFDIRNGDLRRSVRYKKRRKPTKAGSKDRSYRQGHNYEDFQDYMKKHPDTNVVEMDCVESKKGESRSILTFTFRNCNLMAHVPFGISGSGMGPGGLCMAGNSFGTGGIQKAFSSDPHGWRF